MLSLATLLCLVGAGCATFASHDPEGYSSMVDSGVYRGVREDWRAIVHPECMEGLGKPLFCLELPFSFVADTLWLPFDATAGTRRTRTQVVTDRDVSHDRRYATGYIVGATYRTRKSLTVRKDDNTLSLLPADRYSGSEGDARRGENFVGLVPAGTLLIVTKLGLEKGAGSTGFVLVWGRFADGSFSGAPVLLSTVSRTLPQPNMGALVSSLDTSVLELVAKP